MCRIPYPKPTSVKGLRNCDSVLQTACPYFNASHDLVHSSATISRRHKGHCQIGRHNQHVHIVKYARVDVSEEAATHPADSGGYVERILTARSLLHFHATSADVFGLCRLTIQSQLAQEMSEKKGPLDRGSRPTRSLNAHQSALRGKHQSRDLGTKHLFTFVLQIRRTTTRITQQPLLAVQFPS